MAESATSGPEILPAGPIPDMVSPAGTFVTRAREKKVRADVLLVERGLVTSRSEAQALIMAGQLSTSNRRIEKAGERLAADAELSLKARQRYVSRGGEKLHHALAHFSHHGLDVAARVCLDIGASTGGFSDCLLQHGATRIYAVDVGYGQLHTKLVRDPRIINRERTNARHLTAQDFPESITLIVVDASFIGIAKLLPAIALVAGEGCELVALVKPQFEAGQKAVTQGKGVIRDEKVRADAIEQAIEAIAQTGFTIVGGVDSSIRGPKGNLEHLVYARRQVDLAPEPQRAPSEPS